MGADKCPDTIEKSRVLLGNYNPHVNNNVINSEIMEELPSSRKDGGILEDVDAMKEWVAVKVQPEATQPLSQP